MTTTFFKVMFSMDLIAIENAFCEDGKAIVFNEWTTDEAGDYFYYSETMDGARAALKEKIEQQEAFFNEALEKYPVEV